jgi:predicted ThiF/HesA family dinucleotide-utilizing enzyme
MNKLNTLFILAVGVLFSGCMQFDYVGQKLKPLPPEDMVAFYNSKEEVPPNIYRVLGRAVVTAPDGTSTQEVKEELIQKARDYGADAIEVVTFKRVKTGEVMIPQNEQYEGPVGSWSVTSNRPDGTPLYTDTFVDTVPLQTHVLEKYEIRAKVLFLANKNKIKKSIEKYKKDRQSYLHGKSRFSQ